MRESIAQVPSITSSMKSYSFLLMLIWRAREMNVSSIVFCGIVSDNTRSTIPCTPRELVNTLRYSYSMCKISS